MGPAVEAHSDFAFGDSDIGRHIDQVAKDLAGLSIMVSLHALGHQAIEPAGEDKEGHIEVDLHAHRGRQRIDVKEAHGLEWARYLLHVRGRFEHGKRSTWE